MWKNREGGRESWGWKGEVREEGEEQDEKDNDLEEREGVKR